MKNARSANAHNPKMLKRLFRSLLMIAGYVGVAAGATRPGPAATQGIEYRKPEAAPAAWREYAERVQSLFREWLAADDDVLRQFQTRGSGKADAPSTVIVRAWVASDGKVERVEFSGLDERAAISVRSVLAKGNIGTSPPSGMLQPLNLKLSLGDKG